MTTTSTRRGMPNNSNVFANRETRTSESVERVERRWRHTARVALTRFGLAHVGARTQAPSATPSVYGVALAAVLGARLTVSLRDSGAMVALASDSDPTRRANEHKAAVEADDQRNLDGTSRDPIAGPPARSQIEPRFFPIGEGH